MANSQGQQPSQGFVARMLGAHSALGLFAGAIMYLVCLSGTVAVFYEEFEQWEQPDAPVVETLSPMALGRAVTALDARSDLGEHLFVALPQKDAPQVTVSGDNESWFIDTAGNLVQEASHEWTHFLVYLHLYLHLPPEIGFKLVGVAGVLLVALIISGILAHPRIFRDAFSLRWNRSPRLAQADLHNRLSVWASPFHLVIALTGAFIGLASVFYFFVAAVFHDGDTERAGWPLAAGDLAVDERPAPLADVATAYANLLDMEPGADPIFITVHTPGTAGQFTDITAELPRRLIYGERWRFDAAGELIEKEGWSDGPIGKQVFISTYKVHFGSFGGLPVKILYFGFGLALTVVTVSGFNIWLMRRRDRGRALPRLERLWTGLTWGAPIGFATAWMADESGLVAATPVFWATVILALAGAWMARERAMLSRSLRALTAISCITVAVVHALIYGLGAPISFWMNLGWLSAGVVLAWSVWQSRAAERAKLPVALEG